MIHCVLKWLALTGSRRRTTRWSGLALESRQLLAALSGSFGEVLVPPTATDLDVPSDGLFVDGGFEVVGSDADRGAKQGFSASGAGNPVEYFESLLSEGGGMGSNRGFVSGAVSIESSRLYVGFAAGNLFSDQPMHWLTLGEPESPLILGSQTSGILTDISHAGVFVGGAGGGPVYGRLAGEMAALAGLPAGGGAADISANSEFIAGSLLWQADGSGYDEYSTSSFDFTTSGGEPTWVGVEVDAAGNAFFAGEFFNLSTLETEVGFWSETGNFRFNALFGGMG